MDLIDIIISGIILDTIYLLSTTAAVPSDDIEYKFFTLF